MIVPSFEGVRRVTQPLWISSCLLGNAVRYDGKDKGQKTIKALAMIFSHYAICPELEMGMGVPRPSIAWYGDKLLENESRRDHTLAAQAVAPALLEQLEAPRAFIFKSKSPSCAIKGLPQREKGFFAQAAMEKYPDVLVVDENDLISLESMLHFAKLFGADQRQLDDLQRAWSFLA